MLTHFLFLSFDNKFCPYMAFELVWKYLLRWVFKNYIILMGVGRGEYSHALQGVTRGRGVKLNVIYNTLNSSWLTFFLVIISPVFTNWKSVKIIKRREKGIRWCYIILIGGHDRWYKKLTWEWVWSNYQKMCYIKFECSLI